MAHSTTYGLIIELGSSVDFHSVFGAGYLCVYSAVLSSVCERTLFTSTAHTYFLHFLQETQIIHFL